MPGTDSDTRKSSRNNKSPITFSSTDDQKGNSTGPNHLEEQSTSTDELADGFLYATKSIDEEDEQTAPSPKNLPWKKPPLALLPLRIRGSNFILDPSRFTFSRKQKQSKKKRFHNQRTAAAAASSTRQNSNSRNDKDDEFDIDSDDFSPLLQTCFSNIQDYSYLHQHSPLAKNIRQRSRSSDQPLLNNKYTYIDSNEHSASDYNNNSNNNQYSYSYTNNKNNAHRPANLNLDDLIGTKKLSEDEDDISYDASTHMETTPKELHIHTKTLSSRDLDQEYIQRVHSTLANSHSFANANNPSSETEESIMTRGMMKILRCITHNPLSKFIFRLPTLADTYQSQTSNAFFLMNIILEHPKMSFGGLVASAIVLDLIFILPGYLLAMLITEWGVYFCIGTFVLMMGRFVLRMIAFPGATPRLKSDVEGEFQKYSVRMLENAVEAIGELALLIISKENDALLNGNGDKAERMLGKTYGRYDVIPLWKKVWQYRDRVLGMYHDVLYCLLVQGGEGNRSGSGGNGLTKFGNNPLEGDIGKMLDVSEKAKLNGKKIFAALKKVLDDLQRLESSAGDYLNSSMNTIDAKTVTPDGIRAAQRLFVSVSELGDCLLSLAPDKSNRGGRNSGEDDSDDDASQESEINGRRKPLVAQGMDSVKAAINGILETIDPPPLHTIFGLDVLRGALLSRYRGAKQIWIPRPKSQGGGYIDAIHLPSSGVSRKTSNGDRIEKAVMFCNPNAGLVEVSMGFSLISGNVSDPTSLVLEFSCWADYYLHHGYDVILFNYTGYGRSHAGNRKTKADLARGIHIFRRMFSSTFFGFKPSPASLKADATTTASHIIENLRVDKFLIHGESIGGMAASGAANVISNRKYVDSNSLPVTYPTLLICDRTFCNLNATAFRLVGSWTQYVIPLITPLWNTNVAGDFTSARCRKVVAQDAQDIIIHDASSLKKGISTAKEFTKGETKGLGTFGDEPLTYRMADLENVGVRESKYAKFPSKMKLQAPVWPADKHIDLPEAFHFAACARRIGKVATKIRKQKLLKSTENFEDEEEGIEITAVFSRDTDQQTPESNQNEDANIILQIWDTLGLCDGLTGLPLGAAVKDGYDSTIDWLSGMVTLGSQRVVLAAEKRCKTSQSKHISFENVTVEDQDFEVSFAPISDSSGTPPLPLPYVSQALQAVVDSCDAISTDDNPIKIGKYGVFALSSFTSTYLKLFYFDWFSTKRA